MSETNIIAFAPAAERLRLRRPDRSMSIDQGGSWSNHFAGGIDDLWIGPFRFNGTVITLH